jgi:phage-related protein
MTRDDVPEEVDWGPKRGNEARPIDTDIWVIHAFQKKSKSGIKTPQMEVDLIRDRLRRLKEALK